jgi:autotransporter-associated beta strand protein/T5SS/PEP-CTERM-associated repeat protein
MKRINSTFGKSCKILSAGIVSILSVSGVSLAQTVWDGDIDQNWNNAANWAGQCIPRAATRSSTRELATSRSSARIRHSLRLTSWSAMAEEPRVDLITRRVRRARELETGCSSVSLAARANTTSPVRRAVAEPSRGSPGHGFNGRGGNTGTGGRLYVGGRDNGGGGIGEVNVNTSGTLTIRNDLALGSSGGTGVMNVDSGTITTGGWNFFGKNEGGTGGNGTFNMSGGTLTNTGRTYVGQTGTTGKIELTGSGKYLNVNNEQFIVGEGTASSGQIIVNGANAELRSEGELWIGQAAGGNGLMTVSAGTVNVGNWLAVGREGASGVLTINGTGLVQKTDTDGSLELTNAGSATASAIVNLDGGTLRVNNITGSGTAGSVANFFFNGGVLKSTVANADFIGGNVNPLIKNGGAIIDTDVFDITINKVLAPDAGSTGGLTKNGNGRLTLTNANTYTGPTIVSGGTLILESAGSIELTSGISIAGANAKLTNNSPSPVTPLVTVTNGTVDGLGTFDRVTVSAAGTLNNGGSLVGVLNVGTLTFNGAATLELQTTSGAPVRIAATSLVTGAVNSAGLVDINLTNSTGLWTNGTYDLISYSTLGGQGFANLRKGTIAGLGARQAATLTNAVGTIGPDDFGRFSGLDRSAEWELDNERCWRRFELEAADRRYSNRLYRGRHVVFNDSATGTTNVNITTANVNPTSTTFDNSTRNYTISSGGGFGIASGLLTKNGSAAVTLATANTYAGGTTLNAGTLNVNHSSSIGTGVFTVNGGTIDNTSGTPVTLGNNNAIVVAGDLNFNGTNALNLGGGAVTIGSGIPAQTISIANNSTLPGTSLTFGGAVSGASGAAVTVNISGTGNTAFTGNVTKGAASSLVINNSLPGTLTISGSASNITTLNVTGGENQHSGDWHRQSNVC